MKLHPFFYHLNRQASPLISPSEDVAWNVRYLTTMLHSLAGTAALMSHAETLGTSPGKIEMAQQTLDWQSATIAELIAFRLVHGRA